jgi:hypothetical protein
VLIITVPSNQRDTYRIGAGLDLLTVFNRLKGKGGNQFCNSRSNSSAFRTVQVRKPFSSLHSPGPSYAPMRQRSHHLKLWFQSLVQNHHPAVFNLWSQPSLCHIERRASDEEGTSGVEGSMHCASAPGYTLPVSPTPQRSMDDC